MVPERSSSARPSSTLQSPSTFSVPAARPGSQVPRDAILTSRGRRDPPAPGVFQAAPVRRRQAGACTRSRTRRQTQAGGARRLWGCGSTPGRASSRPGRPAALGSGAKPSSCRPGSCGCSGPGSTAAAVTFSEARREGAGAAPGSLGFSQPGQGPAPSLLQRAGGRLCHSPAACRW